MENGYELIERLRKGEKSSAQIARKDIIPLIQKMFRLLVNFDAINAIVC